MAPLMDLRIVGAIAALVFFATSSSATVVDEMNQLMDDHRDCSRDLKKQVGGITENMNKLRTLMDGRGGKLKCDPPFQLVGESCLLLPLGEFMLWNDAEAFCETFQAKLVTLNEISFHEMAGYIASLNHYPFRVWVGLTRQDDGQWKWINDKTADSQWWAEGEPAAGDEKNHACLQLFGKWRFYAAPENHAFTPLCQKTPMSSSGKEITVGN